jgi:LysR family transcriptional regulator, glycine cleavage system transcriptional activator
MRMPPLNGLKTFESAARHLSFKAAAAELGVTQTAVSHQIKRLEQHLGKPLFIRRNRQLSLTDEAEAYMLVLRDAFERIKVGTARLLDVADDNVLTITTITTFAVQWLVPRLTSFQKLHPEIDVRITTSLSLVDYADQGVDAGIRFGRGHWPGMRSDRLMSENIFPVCSPELLKGEHALKSPEDLVHHTLLHISSMPDAWAQWLTAVGVDYPDPTAGPQFEMMMMSTRAAMDGMGVAIVSEAMTEDDMNSDRLIRPFDFKLPTEAAYYFVAPELTADLPKVALFRNWLKDQVADIKYAEPN